MTGSIKYIALLFLCAALLCQASCKTKYLEVQKAYDKAKQKKTALEAENEALLADISLLNDSLNVIVWQKIDQQPYPEQFREIEALKKEFLRSRVPYYLDMKKRQEAKSIKKKK
jgi:hypothetical protein